MTSHRICYMLDLQHVRLIYITRREGSTTGLILLPFERQTIFFFFLKNGSIKFGRSKMYGPVDLCPFRGTSRPVRILLPLRYFIFFFFVFKMRGRWWNFSPILSFLSLSLSPAFSLQMGKSRICFESLPVVIQSAVQFRIFGETCMGQSDSADGA